jgi:protease-4
MSNPITNFIGDVLRGTLRVIRSFFVYTFIFFILIFLGSIVIGVFAGSSTESTGLSGAKVIRDTGGEEKIVYVKLSGVILAEFDGSLLSASPQIITPAYIDSTLREIKRDELVRAVVFQLNSPGGSPVASDQIFESVVNFKEETGIPVVFQMTDLAASGGYYIASAGDFIVANPATLTGSIGVILETFNLQGLYEKLGVEKVIVKQGEYKDLLSESREATQEELEILEKISEDTYEMFIARVAVGRGMPEERVRSLATGQIYTGRQAMELGLVDSLGNFDEAIYQAKSLANIDMYQVVEYESDSFWNSLFMGVRSLIPTFSLSANSVSTPEVYRQY